MSKLAAGGGWGGGEICRTIEFNGVGSHSAEIEDDF